MASMATVRGVLLQHVVSVITSDIVVPRRILSWAADAACLRSEFISSARNLTDVTGAGWLPEGVSRSFRTSSTDLQGCVWRQASCIGVQCGRLGLASFASPSDCVNRCQGTRQAGMHWHWRCGVSPSSSPGHSITWRVSCGVVEAISRSSAGASTTVATHSSWSSLFTAGQCFLEPFGAWCSRSSRSLEG